MVGKFIIERMSVFKPRSGGDDFAIWHNKDNYAVTVKVLTGTLNLDEMVWSEDRGPRSKKPVYLGKIEKMEMGLQKSVSSASEGDIVTLEIEHDADENTLPQIGLDVLTKKGLVQYYSTDKRSL